MSGERGAVLTESSLGIDRIKKKYTNKSMPKHRALISNANLRRKRSIVLMMTQVTPYSLDSTNRLLSFVNKSLLF